LFFLVFFISLVSGSVRQTKLAVRQLLGSNKYGLSYRVSWQAMSVRFVQGCRTVRMLGPNCSDFNDFGDRETPGRCWILGWMALKRVRSGSFH